MEIKKLQIEQFMDGVKSLTDETLNDNNGFILLGYELDGDKQHASFRAGGKLNHLAECIYTCMSKDQGLANIIIAASNAYVQNRMMQAQIQAEATEAPKPKKKRTKKAN